MRNHLGQPHPGRTRRALVALAVPLTLVVASCGGSSDGDARASNSTTSQTSKASSSTTEADTDAEAPAELPGPADTCGGIDGTTAWLDVPDVGRVQTATIGDGDVVAILLHQTNRNGMCGAVPYAEQLAASGVRAVLVNQCGYGASECDGNGGGGGGPARWPVVVAAAVAQARAEGATRVTLVGASAGGTLAVVTAGADPAPPVDAVVDLSGPIAYGLLDAEPAAPRVAQPVLLITAPEDSDGPTEAEAQALLDAMPAADKQLVVATDLAGAHGWGLLRARDAWTPYAEQVTAFVLGT